ncbi:MAG TPA: copper resistance protein CopC [bacterium]|nr:copper resistance protein CopC [bacterium]
MKGPAVIGLLALVALVMAPSVTAHALLSQADPANGATLLAPPQVVTLAFTEDPEPSLSSIRVLTTSGLEVSRGPARSVPGRPNSLRVDLGPLSTGVYTVVWRTVSRIDGHVTGGAFAFGVGVTPSAASVPEVTSPPPSVVGGVARWLLYAGLCVLIGGAWVWTLAFPGAAAGSWRILWVAWLAAALGIAGLAEAQRADAGVDIVRFMRTSLGNALVWRALPLVAIAGSLVTGGRLTGPARRVSLAVVGVLTALAILAHIAGGHAAAASGAWRPANLMVQWLHVSAVGAWIGGLAALLAVLGRTPGDDRTLAVRRFSTVAGVLIVTVAATGTARAVDEVGTWTGLITTIYGRLVLVKAGLLILLAVLGALNRYRSVPAAARTLIGLRRIGAAELVVAAVTLMIAAVLTQSAPAIFALRAAGNAARLAATGSDFATSVRARLQIDPGLPGPNRFVADLRDYDTGRLIQAGRVSLRFTAADRPDLGPSTLDLTRTPSGTYQGQGPNLSLEGKWNVVVVVERGVNSVEIPIAVVVPSQPQRVRTIQAPGQPTLYAIDLSGGRVVDVYLDPGRTGLNEVHATYIDAAGGELPVPRLATMTMTRQGAAPIALPVRRFGPGHFIGDATLGQGEWQLEIVAATAGGEVLRTRLTIQL